MANEQLGQLGTQVIFLSILRTKMKFAGLIYGFITIAIQDRICYFLLLFRNGLVAFI